MIDNAAKRQPGRPPKAESERRGSLLCVRLVDIERAAIVAAAERAGESESEWARRVLLARIQEDLLIQKDGVPHGARSIEIDGQTYWMEQTRGLPRPQIAVVEAKSGDTQGYFYPIVPGSPHVGHSPAESGNQEQTRVVGEIAIKFPFGI